MSDSAGRFRDMLAAEQRGAALYRGMATAASGERREIFQQLAAVEDKHAAHWAARPFLIASWWEPEKAVNTRSPTYG